MSVSWFVARASSPAFEPRDSRSLVGIVGRQHRPRNHTEVLDRTCTCADSESLMGWSGRASASPMPQVVLKHAVVTFQQVDQVIAEVQSWS